MKAFCLGLILSVLSFGAFADGEPQNVWVTSVCEWGNSGVAGKSNPTEYCFFAVTDVVYPGYPPGVLTYQGITKISDTRAEFFEYNDVIDLLSPMFAESRRSNKYLNSNGYTRVTHASCTPGGGIVHARIYSWIGDENGLDYIGQNPDLTFKDGFEDSGTGYSAQANECFEQPPPHEEDDDVDPFLSWEWYPGDDTCSGTPIQYSSTGGLRIDLLAGDVGYKSTPDGDCEVADQYSGGEPLYKGYYTSNCVGLFDLFYTVIEMTGSGVDAYISINPFGVCTTIGPPGETEVVW